MLLNPVGEMPKNTLQKGILLWFYLKKLMVYNVILMETNGISVMVSIGLLFFFLAGWTPKIVVGDGDVWNLKKLQDKKKRLIFFTKKAFKSGQVM